ncbi:MAG TPA: ABC transporter permease [Ktedonobacteraceae bacterium]|nr:ABC transporter permease [Ktedonobacteraceae bacterium]
MRTLDSSLRVIWACLKKDLKSARAEPLYTLVSIILPLNVLLLMSLLVISGGLAPTAVVMQDTGPLAQQFYTAMSQAHSFVLQQSTAQQANALIEQGKIVAIVTVPADFDARIRQRQSVTVGVQINNLNTDFTNDIRRALPLSITSFYGRAEPSVVTITPQERDTYPQDLGYVPFLAVPILVIGLMVGGMVQAGTAAAVEWEKETMKELLLSPASRLAILLGKMLAAFLTGLTGAAIVLAVLIAVMGIWPVHWGELIGFTLLILTLFTAWGTLLGTWLKRRTPLATLAIGLSVPMFFLSGPFGPISFFAPIEQLVARVFPVYYAIVVLQHAVHDFTLNTSGIGINALILVAYALGGLVLATIVVRRSTLAH